MNYVIRKKKWGFHLFLLLIILVKPDYSAAEKNLDKKNLEISDGNRITISKKGFSITPPVGWEIHREYPNLSLLMQVPYSKEIPYQRTIQVMIIKGFRYIDDITRQEFEKVLVKKYSKMSQSIRNYRVRNHLITKMADGREGILYYTEFQLASKKMMQAHILISSDRYSYLLTYTDVIAHFEGDESSMYLSNAWESMTSVRLAGEGPVRFQKIFLVGMLVIAILILLTLIYLIRHAKASRSYSEDSYQDGDSESVAKSSSGSFKREYSEFGGKTGLNSHPPSSIISSDEWGVEENDSASLGDQDEGEDEKDIWK